MKSQRSFYLCLFLAFATLSVYWQVGSFDFTNYDDPFLIYWNPIVCGGLTFRGILWALTTHYYDFWHPMTWWSHMLDCELFGLRPGLHHLVSVGFHTANTLLLFTLLQRMTGAWKRSAMVAALFALHPLHVESVAWLAERKDVLSAFFFLLSLLSYVRYVNDLRAQSPHSRFFYRLALLLFACGLMSKAMVVTLPFVLLLLDYWPLQRVSIFSSRVSGSSSPGAQQTSFRSLIREKIPFFALAFISCVITYSGMKGGQNVLSAETVPWSFRLANVPVSYARYLWKIVWPVDLTICYPSPGHWDFWQVGGAVLVLLLISLLVLVYARRALYLFFGWLFFLGTLVPVVGIVAMSFESIADRYTYIPAIGIFVAVVWTIGDFSVRWKWRNFLLNGAAFLAVVSLACLTWTQIGHWRNSVTLWSHCLAVTRQNTVAHYNLGYVFHHSDRLNKAMEQYRQALRIKPDHLDANLNLGIGLLATGKAKESTNYLANALRLKPDYALAHENMGIALLELENFAQALAHCNEAVRLGSNNPRAFTGIGRALSALGKSDEALRSYSEALRLSPVYPDAHYYRGVDWLKRGMFDEAVSDFREAVRFNSSWADAHFQLATALTAKHATREAIAEYREALRLNPNSPGGLNNLAWILATHPETEFRNGAEAVRLAERACELTSGKQTVFLGTLAAAYAEAGQFEKAVATAQKACDLASSLGETNLLERNQELLRKYKKGEPHREPD